NAGAIVARMASSDGVPGIQIVGFLDDDRRKHGSRLLGHRVYGGRDALEQAAARTDARQLLVAMPSASSKPVRRAGDAAQHAGLALKTLPALRHLVTGPYQVPGIRSVSVEDLLRRDTVDIDTNAIASSIN